MTFKTAVEDAYNKGASTYASSWIEPHPWMEGERQRALSYVKPGKYLLDVGCGPGHDTAFFHSHKVRAIGIDLSEEMVSVALSLHPQIIIRQLSLTDVAGLGGPPFDLIWASYSLLHTPLNDYAEALNSLAAVLRPGGVFFLAMSIRKTTFEESSTIAGLRTSEHEPIEVPIVRWNVDDLRSQMPPNFKEEWCSVTSVVGGTYTGFWRSARDRNVSCLDRD